MKLNILLKKIEFECLTLFSIKMNSNLNEIIKKSIKMCLVICIQTILFDTIKQTMIYSVVTKFWDSMYENKSFEK